MINKGTKTTIARSSMCDFLGRPFASHCFHLVLEKGEKKWIRVLVICSRPLIKSLYMQQKVFFIVWNSLCHFSLSAQLYNAARKKKIQFCSRLDKQYIVYCPVCFIVFSGCSGRSCLRSVTCFLELGRAFFNLSLHSMVIHRGWGFHIYKYWLPGRLRVFI